MKTPAPRRLLLCAALAAGTLVTSAARADDKAACLDASAKGQRHRGSHMLVEAREELRACAAARCPAVVQTDCARWLDEVEAALPTVVVTARSGSGVDLFDVKVSVDGKLLASKLDGQAVPMNAGPHTFHFEGADGTSRDQQVMIREGEKNQAVTVVLGAAAAPKPASTGGTGGTESTGASSGPWRTVGWVLGGVGVAGLGMGTVFGLVAMNDKNGAHCGADNLCDPGTSSGIKSAAVLSDVGWIMGGVLLASGAAMVLLLPGASHEPAAQVRVAPVLTAGGGGAVLGGAW